MCIRDRFVPFNSVARTHTCTHMYSTLFYLVFYVWVVFVLFPPLFLNGLTTVVSPLIPPPQMLTLCVFNEQKLYYIFFRLLNCVENIYFFVYLTFTIIVFVNFKSPTRAVQHFHII